MKDEINMTLDFSIIVTTYNCADYIKACLQSILKQRYVTMEVICVDDCSSDNSVDVLKEISTVDNRVRCFENTENLGPSSSRNIGLKEATGRFVCFVDGDDMLMDDALYSIKMLMIDNCLDLLSYSGLSFTEDSSFTGTINEHEYMLKGDYPKVLPGIKLLAGLIDNVDRIRNCVFNCISRDYLVSESICFRDGLRYAEDNMFRFFIKAKRVLYINHPFYKRRYRKGSIMTSPKTGLQLESFILSYLDDIMWLDTIDLKCDEERIVEKYLNRKYRDVRWFDSQFDESELVSFEPRGMVGYFYRFFIRKGCMYDFMISDDDKKSVVSKSNIFIYGAKNNAIIVAELLESWNKHDYCFVTTGKPEVSEIKGKPVVEFSSLLGLDTWDVDDSIFIIATSITFHDEIEKNLSAKGLPYCKINV